MRPVSCGGPADVTILVPTFNEKENIAALIDTLRMQLHELRWEVIVVDDDSPDGTADEVRRIATRDPRVRCIRRIRRRGLAGACLEGILAAQADIVVVMDADLQHDGGLIPAMHAAVVGGVADVVVASRFLDGSPDAGLTGPRLLASKIAIRACRKLLGVDITDPMSGFFAARRSDIEALAPHLSVDGFKLLLDIIVTSRRKLRVLELAYAFQPRAHGRSKLDARVSLDFAALFVAKLWDARVSPRLVKQLCMAAVEISVQIAALWLLVECSRRPFAVAELGAVVAAASAGFGVRNRLTFSDRRRHGWGAMQGLFGFYSAHLLPGLANVAVAAWIDGFGNPWWLAGLAGAVVGSAWSHATEDRLASGISPRPFAQESRRSKSHDPALPAYGVGVSMSVAQGNAVASARASSQVHKTVGVRQRVHRRASGER